MTRLDQQNPTAANKAANVLGALIGVAAAIPN